MNRRGTILLAVLLVVTIASMVAATSIYAARAELVAATVTLKRTQARALAWSGVQAVMAELAGQREALLDGEMPRLTEEWELYEEAGVRAVVRLIPLDGTGAVVTSEAARLSLNTASTDMLTAVGFEQRHAAVLAGARQEQEFSSVEDVLQVPGVGAQALRGGAQEESGHDDQQPRALAELLTVWSFDPNVQSGLGNDGSRHRGRLRVNLGGEWSERLASAIEDRFGAGASQAVKAAMDRGVQFKSLGDIVTTLTSMKVDVKEWPGVLDAFTTSEDPYVPGRIDLNLAPVELLACIPGLDRAAAEQIVQLRQSLDAEARRSIAWVVSEGLITPQALALAADHLTTRSLQWRVRIEVGLAGPGQGARSASQATLRDRVVWEAVIDVASERPRVAYLRDVTMQRAAAALYESLIGGDEDEVPEPDLASLLAPFGSEDLAPEMEQPDLSLLGGPAEIPGLSLPGLGPRRDLSFAGPTGGRIRRELSSAGAGSGDESWLDLDLRGESPRLGPWDLGRSSEYIEEAPSEPGKDRRRGRWTSGKQGGAQ